MSTARWVLLHGLVLSAGLLIAPQAFAAALSLPGAGAVVEITNTPLRDGFDQRIRFSGGDGENSARIVVHDTTADLVFAFPNDMAKPTADTIQMALNARFPGQALTIQRQPRRNAYGPVGLAVSADCLYAWQWIEWRPSDAFVASGLIRTGLARGAASIRIRLCRTERASLPALLATIERMRLDLSGTWLPGRSYGRNAASPGRQSPAFEDQPRRPARSRPVMTRRNPAPVVDRQIVPVEPVERAPARPAVTSRVAPAAPGSSSQRFITDVMPGAEGSGRERAMPKAAAPPTNYGDRFTPNLPSQALQPPETR